MYATRYVVVVTEVKRRINDGRKVHVNSSVDMTEPGTFIRDEFIRVSGLCNLQCFGPTGHYMLGSYPHHG